MNHRCDERCICPVHKTFLIYAPSIDDHACPDVDCRYGHGMNKELENDYRSSILNTIFNHRSIN